jgi:hypothetical protein
MSINNNNYPVVSVGEKCFQKTKIETIILPETIRSIMNNAFENCDQLTSISLPDSLTSIGTKAFSGCTLLESIKIPKNVSTISTRAFVSSEVGFITLDNIEVDPENSHYCVIGDCLIEKNTKTLHTGTNKSVIPSDGSVTRIAQHAFFRSKLENIVIPDCIERIESNAFARSIYLTEITLPTGCTISDTVFSWCYSLSKVTLPSDIKEITTYAFNACPIETLVIPAQVTSLTSHSFSNNSALKTVTFTTPASPWPTINLEAFVSSGHDNGLVFNVPWLEREVIGDLEDGTDKIIA